VAQNIAGVGASGAGAVNSFIDEFDAARGHGLSLGQAFQSALYTAPEGGQKALDAWADQRVAETGSRLTPTQQAYYRSAMFESFAGVAMFGDYNSYVGRSSQLHEQLRNEHGEAVGTDIANLLRRAAGQNRSDLLNLVSTYNAANQMRR
jgi:conjugal transfer mating pair stabilization protein TraG